MRRVASLLLLASAAAMSVASCGKGAIERQGGGEGDDNIPSVPVTAIPGHEALQDNRPKEGPRMLPTEVYLRTIGLLLGNLTPAEVEKVAQGELPGEIFDRWRDYLASLGLPDYRIDVNRATGTNSLMIATYDRLAIALCVRAVEREIRGTTAPSQRKVFAFELTKNEPTDAEFAERFDVLHRTFLGYPANLAETDRTNRFRELYRFAVSTTASSPAPVALSPRESGWAAVCYGLARHPEFHLY